MQTWITDYDIEKSAANLDQKRLGSQIYEGIHILSSLLGVNDKLVNPKRDVSNYPQSKLWVDNVGEFSNYIDIHINEWVNRGYKCPTNIENMKIIRSKWFLHSTDNLHDYVCNELIQTHRSVLIQKFPEHYRKLWPDCPDNLEMRYDWKDK